MKAVLVAGSAALFFSFVLSYSFSHTNAYAVAIILRAQEVPYVSFLTQLDYKLLKMFKKSSLLTFSLRRISS